MLIEKIGVELEFWASLVNERHKRESYERVDVFSHVGAGKIMREGCVKTDAGRHQGEMISDPCHPSRVFEVFSAIQEGLPSDWTLWFTGRDVLSLDGEYPAWSPKPRYEAFFKALEIEAPNCGHTVRRASMYSATHIHFPVDPFSPLGVRLFNYLTNWAAPLGVVFANPHPSERLRKAWVDFAAPERLPRYLWFRSPDEFIQCLLDVPQLLICEDGVWRPHLKKPDKITTDHLSCIWWWVRPRPDFGTIEFRVLDSMSPHMVQLAVNKIVPLVEYVLSTTHELPRLSELEWLDYFEHQSQRKALVFLDSILPA